MISILIIFAGQEIPSDCNSQRELLLDIQVYLDVMEIVHSAAGGEGVQVLFRILNRYGECPEPTVIPQFLPSLIAACVAFIHRTSERRFSMHKRLYFLSVCISFLVKALHICRVTG